MTEYAKMKKPELQALLKSRGLPSSGNKDVLIERLEDNDAPQAQPSLQPDHENQRPLLEGALEALRSSDPREVAKSLRELVHAKNRSNAAQMLAKDLKGRRGHSNDPWRMMLNARKLKAGKCLEPTCPLCGTGTLCASLDRLCGSGSKCTDRSCNDLDNCSNCRGQIQELEDKYTQRQREDCADGSCGDLFKCLQCENRFHNAKVPLDTPKRISGEPLDPWITGDATELRYLVSSIKTIIHNEYLSRLLRKLQDEKPSLGEWTHIKQQLKSGKCLATTCSLCSTATMSESLEALSHGFKTDCGGSDDTKCSEIFTCSSCRQAAQNMEDTLSRFLDGSCKSGHCDSAECSGCRKRLAAADSGSDSSHDDDDDEDDDKYCFEDDCGGIKTCGLCRYEKMMEKAKRAEEADDEKRMRRFERLGHCDGPDPDGPDSDLFPYGLGCRLLDCERCRMIEAKNGPKMRNDELRRRRVNNIKTSLTESSDGTMRGASRKRRFSNLDLHYPLQPEHPLAKRIREEKQREKLLKERARFQHERPPWFGTPEDPLPDLWMGRPTLPEQEIRILKVLDSQPKFYLRWKRASSSSPREKRRNVFLLSSVDLKPNSYHAISGCKAWALMQMTVLVTSLLAITGWRIDRTLLLEKWIV